MTTQQRSIRPQPQPPSGPSASKTFVPNLSTNKIYAPQASYAIGRIPTTISEHSPSSSYSALNNRSTTGHHPQQQILPHNNSTRAENSRAHVHALPEPPHRQRYIRPLPAVPTSANVQGQTQTGLPRVSAQSLSAPANTIFYEAKSISYTRTPHAHNKSSSFDFNSSASPYSFSTYASTSARALANSRHVAKAASYSMGADESISNIPDGNLIKTTIFPNLVTHNSTANAAAVDEHGVISSTSGASLNYDKISREPLVYKTDNSSSTVNDRDQIQVSLTSDVNFATPSAYTMTRKATRPTFSSLQIPPTELPSLNHQDKQKVARPSNSQSSLTVQPSTSPVNLTTPDFDPRSPKSFRTALPLTPTTTPSLMSRALSRRSSASSLRAMTLTPTPSLFPLPPSTAPGTLMKAWELLEPKLGEIQELSPKRLDSTSKEKQNIKGINLSNSVQSTHVPSRTRYRPQGKSKSTSETRPRSRSSTSSTTSIRATSPVMNKTDVPITTTSAIPREAPIEFKFRKEGGLKKLLKGQFGFKKLLRQQLYT